MNLGTNSYDLVMFIFTVAVIAIYQLGQKIGYDRGYHDGSRDKRLAKRKTRRLYGTISDSEIKIREY